MYCTRTQEGGAERRRRRRQQLSEGSSCGEAPASTISAKPRGRQLKERPGLPLTDRDRGQRCATLLHWCITWQSMCSERSEPPGFGSTEGECCEAHSWWCAQRLCCGQDGIMDTLACMKRCLLRAGRARAPRNATRPAPPQRRPPAQRAACRWAGCCCVMTHCCFGAAIFHCGSKAAW